MRGYFGIGIWHPQKATNVGGLFRSAQAFGADFLFTVGRKYAAQSTDTGKSIKSIPYFPLQSEEALMEFIPSGARLVVIELADTAHDLVRFVHPERAVYLLGSEGGGIPKTILQSQLVVQIPTSICLNVASAGTVVLYDRVAKSRIR